MGLGRKRGQGDGRGRGQGPGRKGGPRASGPGGYCICPNCGYKVAHKAGEPCFEKTCKKCGATMTRD